MTLKALFLILSLSFVGLTWTQIQYLPQSSSDSEVASAVFSQDSSKLITAGASGTMQVWSIPDFELLKVIQVGSTVNNILTSPDNNDIYASTVDGKIYRYDIETYDKLEETDYPDSGYARDIEWSTATNELLVVGSSSGSPKVYSMDADLNLASTLDIPELDSGVTVDQIDSAPSGDYTVSSIAGDETAANGSNGTNGTGTNIYSYTQDGSLITPVSSPDNGNVNFVAYSEDGAKTAVAAEDSETVQIYTAGQENNDETITYSGEAVRALNLDLSGYVLTGLSGGSDRVSIADYNGNEIESLIQQGKVKYINVSPDEEYIVVGLENGVAVWSKNGVVSEDGDRSYIAAIGGVAGGVFLISAGALAANAASSGGAAGAVGGNAVAGGYGQMAGKIDVPEQSSKFLL